MSRPRRNKDHDIFMRGILSFLQLVEKLLRYALDDNIIRFVDFTTLKPVPDTHIDKRLRISYSDSIHECAFNTDALPEHLRSMPDLPNFRFVFIWEAKSQKETLPIDFQIGGYDDNIRRRDFKAKKEKEKQGEGDPLSIVIPILIYHGKTKWEKKRLYDYFSPYLPDELLAFIRQEKYIVIDIQAMTDAEIEAAINLGELRSAFIALKHGHDKIFFRKNLKKITKFVTSIPTKELLEMYVEMLFEYMQRRSELENDDFNEIVEQSKNEEMSTTFKTIFQVAREEATTLGKKEGKKEGLEQGLEQGLEKAIKAFILKTRMTDAAIAEALEVSEDYVKKVRQELKSTQS